jgi:hypothetical protein
MCSAKDVFEHSENKDISSEYTSKIYFPFLYKDGIDSEDKLQKQRDNLIQLTNSKLSEKYNKNIDMFYEIYNKHTESKVFSQNIRQTGIKYIKGIIYPEFTVKIPIDVIFKLKMLK